MAGKVFGVDLDTLVQRQKSEVPKVVLQTIEYLHSKKAHLEEGLFRIPGNNIKITQLKKQFDTGGNVDLNKHHDLDVHTVACLLKMYLRELPVPVIIPRYYSTYLKVYQNPDPKQRLTNYRKLVLGLPKSNRTLLITTMEYLHLVAANQPVNKMSTLNLALIFAPNLMRAERETLTSIMEDADKVAGTLQALIQEVEYFATGKPPAWFATSESAPLTRAKSNTSPAVPRSHAHAPPLQREESISALIRQANAEATPSTSGTPSSTTTTVPATNLQEVSTANYSNTTAEPTVSTPPETCEPSPVSEIVVTHQPVVEACGEKAQPDGSPQPASPITEDQVVETEEPIANESIPLSDAVLSTLSDITELVGSTPLSPRSEAPISAAEPQTEQEGESPSGRQALTSSLGTDVSPTPGGRMRSLSSYLRSASDTSLATGTLKQPDERLIAKSVKNMKALRASCDLTTNKPRRRLSIISTIKKKSQVFSSHPQLKSFVAMDE